MLCINTESTDWIIMCTSVIDKSKLFLTTSETYHRFHPLHKLITHEMIGGCRIILKVCSVIFFPQNTFYTYLTQNESLLPLTLINGKQSYCYLPTHVFDEPPNGSQMKISFDFVNFRRSLVSLTSTNMEQ